MMIARLAIAATLLAGTAHAADIAPSYSTPDYAGRVGAVVTLCPSADGSNSAVVCGTGGTASIAGPLPAGTNSIGSVKSVAPTGTPAAGTNTSITTGGTAVTVFAANTIVNGAVIQNPAAATEPLFINVVTTAGTAGGGANISLAPGQMFPIGPLTTAVTANAVTSAHVFSAYRY